MARGFVEAAEKVRRFYKAVSVDEADGGYGLALDGRRLRTPGGIVLVLPTRALAEEIAAEWSAQGEFIERADMHATRLANTAVDAVPKARSASAQAIAQYAASDLLCYFAEGPQALVQRQTERWGPMLERAQQELALAFVQVAGIVHEDQPEETLQRVRDLALAQDDFGLAGLAFGAPLFGSAVLAIGLMRGWVDGDQALELSRLDEAYQEEKWGVDAEAAERTARLRIEAQMLERWFKALA